VYHDLIQLTDLNNRVQALWQEKIENFLSAYKVVELLALQLHLRELEEKLATFSYLGKSGPAETLWNSYGHAVKVSDPRLDEGSLD
jgi:dimeric dUTPase (all-alpha-NTP-PPase superfamily)